MDDGVPEDVGIRTMTYLGDLFLQGLLLSLLVSFLVSLRWFRSHSFPRSATYDLRAQRKFTRRQRRLFRRGPRFCRECGHRL